MLLFKNWDISITLKFLASLEKWKALAAPSLCLLMAAGGWLF